MIDEFDFSMLYLSKDIFFDNDEDTTKFANDDDTNNYNKNDIIEGNNEKIMRIIYDYIHDNKITRPRFIHFFNKK